MERIKDWRSYQKVLNRNKRRGFNNRTLYHTILKTIGFSFIFALVAIGGFKLFSFTKDYYATAKENSIGTGIKPLRLLKTGNGNASKDSKTANRPTIANFSLSALKKYFQKSPPEFTRIKNGRYIQKAGKYTVIYTLDPVVQKEAEKVFAKYNVRFGALVAVNPETGAILGYATYASDKQEAGKISNLYRYKSGSIVKIVTASAAIESKGFSPAFNIYYNGGLYGTNKNYWLQNINTGYNKISFKLAFAKSCDIAFGKVAGFYVGKNLLQKYFDRFYFNSKIPFILGLQKSIANIPDKFYSLELTGAGFKNVRITPVLASLLSASVINGGKLLEPYIVKEVTGPGGKVYYRHAGVKILSSPITAYTANILKQMMTATIVSGIGRPDFYNSYNQYLLPGVLTGGKTGTISGSNPAGLYQWFTGFGEEKNRKIAIAALVVEQPIWKIAGGGVSEKVLFSYFFKNNKIKNLPPSPERNIKLAQR